MVDVEQTLPGRLRFTDHPCERCYLERAMDAQVLIVYAQLT